MTAKYRSGWGAEGILEHKNAHGRENNLITSPCTTEKYPILV